MTEYVKVQNHPDLVKDTQSGAVISNDSAAFAAYINRKDKQRKESARLDIIENELSEVKELLHALLKRLN